jgi:phage-related protein
MGNVPCKSFSIPCPERLLKRGRGKLGGTEDIWECRIQFGSNAYRIFCFFLDNSVVLTHGFVKKSQKTPARELERAEVYRRDFFKRRV